jgi:hypothetical protein
VVGDDVFRLLWLYCYIVNRSVDAATIRTCTAQI